MNHSNETKLLENALKSIMVKARNHQLDFYPMRFEVCPAEIIYTFGAYGMPARFTHWSFGKSYHKMKMQYDYNLSRIYEMVINSNPCYAFLLEGNSLIQNKMVMAHVLGHCDFFKNNAWFKNTNRDMVESMSVASQRFRSYEQQFGQEKVEKFIDAVLSVQPHIDPHKMIKKPSFKNKNDESCKETPYDDLWDIGQKKACSCQDSGCQKNKQGKIGEDEQDLMLFLLNHAKDLEEWQKDIISVLRDEMLYFWPQMQTKIMNEGWATYWHMRIMREIDLAEDEAIEFAKMHAGVIQPSKLSINPYYVGLKIFEDIEKRWDYPSESEKEKYHRVGGEGREKIFEVRMADCDVSFFRNYLTKELVDELDLYLYRKVGYEYKIVEKNWQKVRDELVKNLSNCGVPTIHVTDGDYKKRGELYLIHLFEGLELDLLHLEKTLQHVYFIWSRPVHLETVVDARPVLFSFDGSRVLKNFI